MKYTIASDFHGTSKLVSIKKEYGNDPSLDVLGQLDYDVFCSGSLYAKRKLAEIKKALCGQPDCQCVFTVERIKL